MSAATVTRLITARQHGAKAFEKQELVRSNSTALTIKLSERDLAVAS